MIKKRTLHLIAVISAISIILSGSHAMLANASSNIIDNSDLMPKYVPDSEVEVNSSGTPEWINSLIIAEIRIGTCTPEGTFASAVKVLDHYQEMGVNGIWVTPINDPGETGNGYSNLGLHTVDPALSGKEDYEEGWAEFKNFVDEAHKRDIRIILDIISWGTVKESPLYDEHSDWYSGTEEWGGINWEWSNEEFKEWYMTELIDVAMKTGVDGFRYDCEPKYLGYEFHKEVRERLLAKGRKLLMMTEGNNERLGAYDLGQYGVPEVLDNQYSLNPTQYFLEKYNIVDSIKTGDNIGSVFSQQTGEGGNLQHYTYMLNCHDNQGSVVCGNRVAIGYQAIYAPFIPLWYIGEEWHNYTNENPQVQYVSTIDWDKLDEPENRAFYEDVKAMIRVRRQYPEIFNYFPESLRDTNICKVNVAGCEGVQSYARYMDDTAIIIVPNYNVHDKSGKMTVYMPFEGTGLENYKKYTVTNAVTGEAIVSGSAAKVAKINVTVPYEDMLVLKVKAEGKIVQSIDPTTSESTSSDSGSVDNYEPVDNDNLGDNTVESEASSKPDASHSKDKADKNNNFPWILCASIGGVLILGVSVTFVLLKVKKKKE